MCDKIKGRASRETDQRPEGHECVGRGTQLTAYCWFILEFLWYWGSTLGPAHGRQVFYLRTTAQPTWGSIQQEVDRGKETWPDSIHTVFSRFPFTFYSVFLIPITLPFIMYFSTKKKNFFFKVHVVCQRAREPGLEEGRVILNMRTTLAGSWYLDYN